MAWERFLRTRIDPSPLMAGLAVGDVVAILAFVTVGEFSHAADPLGNPELVLTTAAPFLVGWLVVAVLGRLYTHAAVATARRAAIRAAPAWIVGSLLGQAIRATEPVPGDAPLTFVLVTMLFGGFAVVGWRVIAAVVLSRR